MFESASDSSIKDECVKENVETFVPKVVDTKTEESRKLTNQPRPTVRYAEMYRNKSPVPRGNQRSWNHLKSQQLGNDFVLNNKACHICGSFDHLHAKCDYHLGRREVNGPKRVYTNKFQNNTHPNSHSNMIPRAVQLNNGLKSVNTAHTKKNWTVLLQTGIKKVYPKSPVKSAKPNTTFSKSAQTGKRTFYEKKVVYKQQWVLKVNVSKPSVSTARPKIPTARSVNKNKGNMENAVKASARWEWKPKGNITSTNPNGVSMTFDRFNYIDTQGRSKSIMAWVSRGN